ncbi:DUF819 family protein [Alteromonas sp. ASW11-130]|uniref:DUF819 family protein n=1 Tax=Alteromonas sp. ASW11-130 TaxID=3015775 RepID=UPI00224285BE|nr:DUF819 family protein [Alteromonas sp. ASW11-130]MCW8092945.1 DUF819 family protein [Alteromonas sp. ASW11-130]
MITSALGYVTALIVICGVLRYLDEQRKVVLFKYVPSIVLVYFLIMLASTFNLWTSNEEIDSTYKQLRGALLPAMIFLMLLQADLRQIKKLGLKMVIAFFCASLTIAFGFVVAFALFHTQLPSDAWKTFAALSGSWMGGTGNMVAVQSALEIPNERMGYTLLIDSINYSIWVMLLLALVPLSTHFAKWTKADTALLKTVGENLQQANATQTPTSTSSLFVLLGWSFLCTSIAISLATKLPSNAYFGTSAWVVMLVTLFGIVAAMTPLSRYAAGPKLATLLLYLVVALIASRANFNQLTDAPLYILIGFVILGVHGVLMIIIAKLLKFDLFTCGIASLANIGGVASAPILAAAYSRALVPVGVLMAMLGYIVGTAGGLAIGRVLSTF